MRLMRAFTLFLTHIHTVVTLVVTGRHRASVAELMKVLSLVLLLLVTKHYLFFRNTLGEIQSFKLI